MGKILLLSTLVATFATANLSADAPVGSAYVGFGTTGPIVGYDTLLAILLLCVAIFRVFLIIKILAQVMSIITANYRC